MMSAQENDLITNISVNAPAGRLMRHYWQPAALVEEMRGERPVKAVQLLGEDLVLFRDAAGHYGLMERHCPHRGADLCFGRLENGGLRCPFHGWLFDVAGNCLEQPAEPESSKFHQRLRHTAYPCIEHNGIIFAYMGTGEPPAFPNFDCFVAPDRYTFAFKGLMECNWLQALEVGIDPAHASFLHRFFEDADPSQSYGQQFRDAADLTDIPLTRLLRDYPRPDINVEPTEYGFRIITTRRLDNKQTHYRITNLAFPHAIVIPMSREMTITQWHVPINNFSCYWYAIFTSFGEPVDSAAMRKQRLELYLLPDYIPRLNRSNNWGFDPHEQATKTFTGMGLDINVHDQWACESLGAVQDRTREHLGKSDVAIVTYRRMLKEAIRKVEDGEKAPFTWRPDDAATIRGPVAIDAIGDPDSSACWEARDRERREQHAWARLQ